MIKRTLCSVGFVLLLCAGAYHSEAVSVGGRTLSVASMNKTVSSLSPNQTVPSPGRTASAAPQKMAMRRSSMVTASMTSAPTSTSFAAESMQVVSTPQGYAVVEDRPDFSYRPAALRFIQQNTFTSGQIGMGIGPGLPTGTVRYVPVGEF